MQVPSETVLCFPQAAFTTRGCVLTVMPTEQETWLGLLVASEGRSSARALLSYVHVREKIKETPTTNPSSSTNKQTDLFFISLFNRVKKAAETP